MAAVLQRFLPLLSALLPLSSPVSLATFDQRQPSASSAFHHPKDSAYKGLEEYHASDSIFPRFVPGQTLPAEVPGKLPGDSSPEAAFYEEGMPRSNITAIEGREIQLPCKVVHLANKTVSPFSRFACSFGGLCFFCATDIFRAKFAFFSCSEKLCTLAIV